mgnify:CR=1 FL=1
MMAVMILVQCLRQTPATDLRQQIIQGADGYWDVIGSPEIDKIERLFDADLEDEVTVARDKQATAADPKSTFGTALKRSVNVTFHAGVPSATDSTFSADKNSAAADEVDEDVRRLGQRGTARADVLVDADWAQAFIPQIEDSYLSADEVAFEIGDDVPPCATEVLFDREYPPIELPKLSLGPYGYRWLRCTR